MVLALLIIPVYILWHLTRAIQSGTDTAIIIGLLLVFTLIFSGALSLLTTAQRHEILASAAAYVISKVFSSTPRS
jgi:ABC-type Mn2+/Zn2+ transport system permease subunit